MKTPLTLISLRIERRYWLTILAVLLTLPAFPGHSSDRDREDRLVEEIEANLFDGELISLMPGADSFTAVQMASQTDTTRGGVILLHGRGFHADWPENIGPLRVGLSEAGWHTLSLQMPVLEKSAKYYDYVPILPEVLPRIDAALAHLKAENISPIVLLAHSCGAHMAMLWMEQYADQGIDAFVGIGMGATDYQQPMRHPFPICLAQGAGAGSIWRGRLPGGAPFGARAASTDQSRRQSFIKTGGRYRCRSRLLRQQ